MSAALTLVEDSLGPEGSLAVPLVSARPFAIRYIQAVVADSYGVSRQSMTSPSRFRAVAWPRQVAIYLARETTDLSLKRIGHFFGDRDHSTVFAAIHAVEKRMADDPDYAADVAALREAVRG